MQRPGTVTGIVVSALALSGSVGGSAWYAVDRIDAAAAAVREESAAMQAAMREESAALRKSGDELAEKVNAVGVALNYWTKQGQDK